MTERPYSRVYWSVIDDERFDGIYDDDHHFAWWQRLLLAADMAWPAPASLPLGVRKASVSALVDKGIVELLPGNRYRIHGLDRERSERSEKARTSARVRYAPAVRPQSASSANGLLAEPRQAETSQAEPTRLPARGVRSHSDLSPLRETLVAAGLNPEVVR